MGQQLTSLDWTRNLVSLQSLLWLSLVAPKLCTSVHGAAVEGLLAFSLSEDAGELAGSPALLSHRGLMTMPATARVLAASIGLDKELGEVPEWTSVAVMWRRHAGLRLAGPLSSAAVYWVHCSGVSAQSGWEHCP